MLNEDTENGAFKSERTLPKSLVVQFTNYPLQGCSFNPGVFPNSACGFV